MYLSQNEGFIVVYAIDEPRTFQTAKQLIKLIRELKKQKGQQTAIVLVGNKVDLNHTRSVSNEEALEFASEYECFFHETSAANNINVKIVFQDAVRQLRVLQLNRKANGPMNSIKNFFSRWDKENVGSLNVDKEPSKLFSGKILTDAASSYNACWNMGRGYPMSSFSWRKRETALNLDRGSTACLQINYAASFQNSKFHVYLNNWRRKKEAKCQADSPVHIFF